VFPRAMTSGSCQLLWNSTDGMAIPLIIERAPAAEAAASRGLRSFLAEHDSALETAHRMVAAGEADAASQAPCTRREVLRSALRNIGLAPDVRVARVRFTWWLAPAPT